MASRSTTRKVSAAGTTASTATIGFEAMEPVRPDLGGDRQMSNAEVRTPNRVSHTSTFEIHHSNFASFAIPPPDIGKEHADTFLSVQHPDLRADYVLANPPFNDSDWFRNLTVHASHT